MSREHHMKLRTENSMSEVCTHTNSRNHEFYFTMVDPF